MKGELVDSIPVRGNVPPSAAAWDDAARKAQDNPGKAVRAATHVPLSRISALRMYRRAPYRDEKGNRTLKISMRNSVVEPDGKRYGDVYFEWIGS